MITVQDMERLLFAGGDVVGDDGTRIGRLGQLFLDARTGNPAWVTVTTGLFGKAESFVPMNGAELHGDALHVPYAKDAVKHAPRIESAEGHLTPDEERDLYRHYGLLHDEPEIIEDARSRSDVDAPSHRGRHAAPDDAATGDTALGGIPEPGAVPVVPVPTNAPAPLAPTSPGPPPLHTYDEVARAEHDADRSRADARAEHDADRAGDAAGVTTGGATAAHLSDDDDAATTASTATSPADDGVVLSAEQARVVSTERVPTERVRLRRYTVTGQKQITVPVQREEVRVEYEPADEDALPDASEATSEPHTEPHGQPHTEPHDQPHTEPHDPDARARRL